eukprot:Blabericola_migrator_1__10008@NODE_5542_length_736_cov_105_928251_g535_i2_p1_GENE_NODE_5542_length_736_cov_105_928251_g535_i2NODE_5542_length_736_cov_105_928251_g535_i2_p1_ORF_typecomplete_len166_score21_75_NODE_5542_length_736_cov_105_928251_g535_i2239691
MAALWAVTMFVEGWVLLTPRRLRLGRKILALACIFWVCLEARVRVFGDTLNLGGFVHLLPFEVATLIRSSVSVIFVLSMILSDRWHDQGGDDLQGQIATLMKIQAITVAHLQCLAKYSGLDQIPLTTMTSGEDTGSGLRNRRPQTAANAE